MLKYFEEDSGSHYDAMKNYTTKHNTLWDGGLLLPEFKRKLQELNIL
ncbi:MAG: hypothetical protein U0T84_12205 [Chitinophagales bacterium]